MGLASWRCHNRLGEHAAVAPVGATIRGRGTPVVARPDVLGLNEVGVTDLVMATIWRHGPRAAAFAVSPGAEANHLGADIAILHPGSKRLLIYQAKLARCEASMFLLKSPVTRSQLRFLNRRSVQLQDTRYRVSGRLALYQADITPFIDRCGHGPPLRWWDGWPYAPWEPRGWERPDVQRDRQLGRRYYEDLLVGCGCSPSGIVAAPVPRTSDPLDTVYEGMTWPWEFDTYSWLSSSSPLDGGAGTDDIRDRPLTDSIPDFDQYAPTQAEPPTSEDAAELAEDLRRRLRVPARELLCLVVLA